MTREFAGKVALVTGASYGIGFAIARDLGRRGAAIVLSDVSERVTESAAALSAEGLDVLALHMDVVDPLSVERGVAATAQRFGRLDVMVTNAAMPRTSRTILEMSAEDWNGPMEVNVRGTLFCIQAAARQMIVQGDGGRLVTIASTAGLKPYRRRAHYCTSKAAVIQLTKVAALELSEYGITCNCVCPGQTETENLRSMTDGCGLNPVEAEEMRRRQAAIPLGVNAPEDIANAVAFFASLRAGTVTGQIMAVEGGGLMT